MHENLYRELLDEHEADAAVVPRIAPGRVPATARIARRADQTLILRLRDRNGVAAGAEVLVDRAASSSGAPLPGALRSQFESSLGADLSGVRLHTGGESAAAAAAIGAHAYTVGQDIHFADGRFAPSDPFGLHLLAHEVAHTVQQSAGATTRQHKLEVSSPGDAAEVEADRAADAMVAGARAEVSGGPSIAARANDPNAGNAAAPADPAADADAQGGGVKVTVNIGAPTAGPAIEFDAADYAELYKQVAARAAANQEAGSCECGTIDKDLKTVDDKVTTATYTVPLSISLPVWKQLASQPAADQQKFTTWLASITAHEKQHADIFKTGYAKLKTSIVGPSEADCETQFKAVDAQVDKDQKAFDAANQPAALPAPGGITKVPPSGGAPAPNPGAPAPPNP